MQNSSLYAKAVQNNNAIGNLAYTLFLRSLSNVIYFIILVLLILFP